MKNRALAFAAIFAIFTSSVNAQCFDQVFDDATLRIDIGIETKSDSSEIFIDKAVKWDGWSGRRVNLDKAMYQNVLSFALVDASGDTIYHETKYINPAADPSEPAYTTLIVPFPKNDASISISSWTDDLQHCVATKTANISDLDICHSKGAKTPYLTIRRAADPDHAINIAIISEGYKANEMDQFCADAAKLDSALLSHEAFHDRADRINVVAVMLPSSDSGITYPSKDLKYDTALGAHFDSQGLERLMTFDDYRVLWDAIEGIPACQLIILANTDFYGGSGSHNDYAMASSHEHYSLYTIVHEFGHSFANLGDEYESSFDVLYSSEIEPQEPNITTLHDFSKKWADMVETGEASIIEGAGYQEKGVYRSSDKCIMRDLSHKKFCKVCTRAIINTIDYYTVQK